MQLVQEHGKKLSPLSLVCIFFLSNFRLLLLQGGFDQLDFKILSQDWLGAGTYAVVRRACWKTRGNHKVVIKIFNLDPAVPWMGEACSAAKAELQKTKASQHCHVIHCYRLMLGPDKVGIVMKLAAGGDLAKLIKA